MTKEEKRLAYQKATKEIDAILADETNMILKMTTINCMIKDNFPNYFWIGFYCINADALIVGPYQGTLGCLHINMERGVCGRAARLRTTQIVKDVHADPEHIACDASTNSEIVIPVLDENNELIGVFDLDSTSKAAFDEIDQKYLEAILKKHFQEKKLIKQYIYA
ncbi:MAG: GAF domain-containing protein [Saprospiraceae bacterium]